MAKYIDVEQAIETFKKVLPITPRSCGKTDIYMRWISALSEAWNDIPSADAVSKEQYEQDHKEWLDRYIKEHDARIKTIKDYHDYQPVVHGHWVEEPDRYFHWHCSECEYVISGPHREFNYCPNCGAKMHGDK